MILTAGAIEVQASGLAPARVRVRARLVGLHRASTEAVYGRKAMNWFRQTTSIAGMQVSNWILVIVAVVVLWIIYSAFIH